MCACLVVGLRISIRDGRRSVVVRRFDIRALVLIIDSLIGA